MSRWYAALALLLVIPLAHGAPRECSAKSGASTAALVELYTSEGCDSCPPADKWLRALPSGGFALDRVVPLALHVDYWDYIGWKDPYANPGFTARQREIAAITRNRTIYTPQVVLAGRDHRNWTSERAFASAVRTINEQRPRADIALALREGARGGFELRASANVPQSAARTETALYVAAYENGLSSQVTAGENRGATLVHDFVVREWWGPIAIDAAGTADLTRPISARGVANGGIAAFVQSRRTGEILQALALPACKS